MPTPWTGLRNTLTTCGQLRRLHGVSWHETLGGMLRFRRLLGAHRGDFMTLWLWDRTLPMDQRLRFLSDGDRQALEPYMNPRSERLILRDKARVTECLSRAGIRTPPVLAVVTSQPRLADGTRVLTRVEDLADLLRTPLPTGLVCKPTFGMWGTDVLVFRAADADGVTHLDGRRWTLGELWQRMSQAGYHAVTHGEPAAWKLEPRIPPHPDLERIHGPTLGCLRVVTFRFADGRLGVLDPTWKIPLSDTGIDNIRVGAFTAAVRPGSGAVGRALHQTTMTWHDRHPRTGHTLEGLVLPMCDAAIALARRAAECFPGLGSLGFDIGLAADGPTVIEVNCYWGSWFMQAPHRRGLLTGDFLAYLRELGVASRLRPVHRQLLEEG